MLSQCHASAVGVGNDGQPISSPTFIVTSTWIKRSQDVLSSESVATYTISRRRVHLYQSAYCAANGKICKVIQSNCLRILDSLLVTCECLPRISMRVSCCWLPRVVRTIVHQAPSTVETPVSSIGSALRKYDRPNMLSPSWITLVMYILTYSPLLCAPTVRPFAE
jgi:hypothetical protein